MADAPSGSRFAEVTPDDHAGSIWIASILCLIYSVLTLILRGHLRFRMFEVDDYIATVATVYTKLPSFALLSETNGILQLIQVGEVIAVMFGLHHGLGKTQDLFRSSEVTKASRVSTNSAGNRMPNFVNTSRRPLPHKYSSSSRRLVRRPRFCV